MIGLKESFRWMYSNTHLKSCETLPLTSEVGALSYPLVLFSTKVPNLLSASLLIFLICPRICTYLHKFFYIAKSFAKMVAKVFILSKVSGRMQTAWVQISLMQLQ